MGVVRNTTPSPRLPLGVVRNTAGLGKRRPVWDGGRVDQLRSKAKFVVEAQTEGRSLFGGCSWEGTFDVSQAFHFVDMDPSAPRI